MRIQPSLFILGCSFLTSSFAAAELLTHPLENFHEEERVFSIHPKIQAYTSDSNYDDEGTLIRPSGMVGYTRANGQLPIRWGVTRQWTLFGRIAWSYIQLEQTTITADTFGFTDQTLGLNFRAHTWNSGLSLDFQAQADIPAYSLEDAAIDLTPALGSETYDVTFAAFASYPIIPREGASSGRRFRLVAGAGFTWRSDDFSSLIPWTVGAEYDTRPKGILFEGKFYGVRATDTTANVSIGNPCPNSFLGGGSCYVLAFNPSVINVGGKIGYRVNEKIALHADIHASIWGRAAPKGLWGGLGFSVSMGRGVEKAPQSSKSSSNYNKSNQGFVNYSFKANVVRVNDRFNLVKMNKGSQHGVKVGQIYDIFSVAKNGKVKEAVARGRVTSVRSNEAAIKILEYFKEIWIEEGFVVRRPLN